MAKMNIAPEERPQVKAECLRLLITLQLDSARMQLISGFVDVYLRLNAQEDQVFKATADRIGLSQEEKYMEIITSWAQETAEKIAMNLLREGLGVELVIRVTGLTAQRVQELQAQLQKEELS